LAESFSGTGNAFWLGELALGEVWISAQPVTPTSELLMRGICALVWSTDEGHQDKFAFLHEL